MNQGDWEAGKFCFSGGGADPAEGEAWTGTEDWINCFCTMEMRLKIVEATAEHDFVLRGSSECPVQCSASNFCSRPGFPFGRIRPARPRKSRTSQPPNLVIGQLVSGSSFGRGTCIERFRLRCLGECFSSICGGG